MPYRYTLLLSLLLSLPCAAQTGQWRDYPSYYSPKQIIQTAPNSVYVLASGGLYRYNPEDQSIETYSKVSALTDTDISHIAWCSQEKCLLLVYSNSNMDVMDPQGNVTNISDLYAKATTLDKTVNSVTISQTDAYLATGFGVVKTDLRQKLIAETYILNRNVKRVACVTTDKATDNTPAGIYVQTQSDGTWYGADNLPLDNPNNWTATTSHRELFQTDDSHWQQWIETVSTLQPGGPKHNAFGYLSFERGRLLSSGNGFQPGVELYRSATPQEYDPVSDTWLIYGEPSQKAISDLQYVDMMSVAEDPFKPGHVYGGCRAGIYEYQDGQIVNYLNPTNSPWLYSRFDSTTIDTWYKWLLVEAMQYDSKGQLWMLNSSSGASSGAKGNQLLMLDQQQQWHDFSDQLPATSQAVALRPLFIDSRGLIWFNNMQWTNMATYCFNPETGQLIKTISNDVVNEDGTALRDYQRLCLAEDLEGNIWIGTSQGPVQVDAAYCQANVSEVPYLTQVKVARNDGSGLADYLMAGSNVNAIAVDGGGRKWLGTSAGLYLISADCQQQLEHFTQDNSKLISDNVESLALDHTTGTLYIGTDKGLCSYQTDATQPAASMRGTELVAYPNPVTPDYTGLITITGFTLDADVKILSAAGRLIAQGRSNGGTFTWDGCDTHGRRVASGVYMVAAARSDGSKGAVGKVAIIR